VVPLTELATSEQLPGSFLAKIFQKLARHGILTAHRGAGQGYELSVPPGAVSLLEIVTAVQGTDYLEHCVFWGGRCGSPPCLLHDHWLRIRSEVRSLLEEMTLAELAAGPGIPDGAALPATAREPALPTRSAERGR
jgi:Rrf2 family protein